MKPYKILSLLLIVMLTLTGCGKNDNPSSSEGDNLVGTWVLTKIILTSMGNMELNPQQVGLSGTITLKSDRTFSATFSDADGPSTDSGTWSVSSGKISLKSSSGETQVWPFGISGNKLTIETNLDIPNLGNIPVRLEFTKQ
jgi:hypothetical protein